MTDRINSLTVVLENDMRDDDCAALVNAIAMLRGVISVGMNATDAQSYMAEERARRELGQKLIEVVYPKRP